MYGTHSHANANAFSLSPRSDIEVRIKVDC